MLETEADRRDAIVSLGGEPFDTGYVSFLVGIFDEVYLETEISEYTIANREPVLICRTSDVAEHGIVKQSRLTRVSNKAAYFVTDFEPDGVGMTLLRLRK
jgi:hypothetical protein